MGLLQTEIAGTKIERRLCYLYSFLHMEKVKYETVLTPKFAGSVTDPEDKIVCLLFQLKVLSLLLLVCWFFLVQKGASHA